MLQKNNPKLRQQIKDAGLSICVCVEFKDAEWLVCWDTEMPYDIHGIYPFEDETQEQCHKRYECYQHTNDVETFIEICKQLKRNE